MTVTSEAPAGAVASGAEAQSLPALLVRRAAERGSRVALREKHLGRWRQITWADYERRAANVGLGLLELGVASGDRVAIHCENRPEWLLTDLGVQGIGAVCVGIHPTSPTAEVEFLLGHSESKVLIAEDEEQLDKAMAMRHTAPSLERIVVIDTRGVRDLDDPMVMTFDELERLGEQRRIEEWRERVGALDPSAPALIIYISGTTSSPRGAMLSSENLIAAGRAFREVFELHEDDEALSYLPLCQMAERLGSVVNALHDGYIVNFGEGGESFPTDMREVQPTYFLGVPRVWEKMQTGVQIRMNDASTVKQATYRFWLARGRRLAAVRMKGNLGPLHRITYGLGWLFLYRSLRDKLGLGRARVAVSVDGPVAPQVLEFFWALGVQVRESYGQTEGTAVATCTPAGDVRVGQVGTAMPGCEISIDAGGEILIRSPGVFIGYLNDDEATRRKVDANGWLHTGDIGELDADGFLSIIERNSDQ